MEAWIWMVKQRESIDAKQRNFFKALDQGATMFPFC
jgi:hypothetical protein